MSRPESTGESLESILASIRNSLSEQSTDVLEEETAGAADATEDDAGSPEPARDGLTRRLAESAMEAPQIDDAAPHEAALHAAVPHDAEPGEQAIPGHPVGAPAPGAPLPQPAVPVPAATKAEKDPLWFLGGRGQPAAKQSDAVSSRPAGANGKAPAGESAAPPGGIARGPLPPFFGSKAEAQKAEVVLVQPGISGMGVMPPPAVQPATASYEPSGTPAPVAEMPPPPVGVAAQRADGLRNGMVSSLFGHASADGKAVPGGDTPHIHALEAMVLELLRPMLRQWLDENMPRLVSAALRDQAVRMADRDARKP